MLTVFLAPTVVRKITDSIPTRVVGTRRASASEKRMRIRTFRKSVSGDEPTGNNKPDA